MSDRMSAHWAATPVRVLESVAPYRVWRQTIMHKGESVGFVPTMGALHEGHLQLVDASLRENDHTVVSIFVNPAQFAPHEDLSTYPRTIQSDLERLGTRATAAQREGRMVALLPQVNDMYPFGITQHVPDQVGAFVEVQGLSHQMEGQTRPTFFRGVATVVTKLFNIVLPDRAYFGQKDIQQSIVIRRLVDDLLFTFPHGSKNVRVMPTARDPNDGLALSSRNKYLDEPGRQAAPVLYAGLLLGSQTWSDLQAQGVPPADRVASTLDAVRSHIERATPSHARIELDYVSLNDPETLVQLAPGHAAGDEVILSGAMYVYNRAHDPKPAARLIDNVLIGFTLY